MLKHSYYSKNKEKVLVKKKQIYLSNKEAFSEKNKKYYQDNKEELRYNKKLYYEANKAKILAKDRIRDGIKYANDPKYRLKNILRNRLRLAIKNGQKTGSAISDLGCTIEEFKQYIESKFQPNMTWDNWSLCGWQLDHIIPLYKFDLSNRDEFLKACHYTNMQPLWKEDHGIKSIEDLK